ncbi:uncharacterized protein LOC142317920 [Lycorma delicatula]|uniref:uncharacterized protein LOC142317920 n=1 Tax=Lycorma delicatula TaxID=130591 RepID=UPI003F517970
MLYGGMDPSARQRIPRLRVNGGTRNIVSLINEILEEKVRLVPSITELHELVYIGAITAVKANGQRIVASAMRKSPQRPPWEERLCRKVDELRKEIGRLSSFLTSANPSGRIRSAAESIIRTYENPENTTGHEVLDLLKQRLMVLSCRLRRYRQSNMRREQAHLFRTNQKELYKQLQVSPQQQPQANASPTSEEVLGYWGPLWSCSSQHNSGERWIREERKRVDRVQTMVDNLITLEDVQEAIRKTHNWRAPGIDGAVELSGEISEKKRTVLFHAEVRWLLRG